MGAWGTALFSDDTACDVRDDYVEFLGDGLSGPEATERLLTQWEDTLKDKDEAPVFWLALAATQWKYGRLEFRVLHKALEVIDNGSDLARWDSPKDQRKRQTVLEALRAKLASPQPPEKRVRRLFRDSNEWQVGNLVTYRLLSGRLIILRVIGHHTDKGGTSPIVELLDWVGQEPPGNLQSVPIKRSTPKHAITQFMIGGGRYHNDRPDNRLQLLPVKLTPTQKPREYAVFLWRWLDKLLREDFELE
jgi:hypothetical protein